MFHYLCLIMGEFELIAAIEKLAKALPTNGFEGIGDDCAVLEIGGGEALVFTSDALCEGVHFLSEAIPPRALGEKSLAVNLSDVASMGVRPVAVLLSLSIPETIPTPWIEELMEGFTALAKQHGVALVGGDTTRSKSGLVLNITAIGRGKTEHLKRRRDARVGDVILVSDRLGASAAGLKEVLAGRHDTPLATIHHHPTAEIEAGAWLGEREEVHAMMDLSDGLASDLKHILKASQVGAEVELTAIPVAEGATRSDALTGGEDYKLLLTADATQCAQLMADFQTHFGRELYAVGRITASCELRWLEKGIDTAQEMSGFCHF